MNARASAKFTIVNDLGQLPGSPEYEKSLKIWREFRERR
jgi:hypothetical protein